MNILVTLAGLCIFLQLTACEPQYPEDKPLHYSSAPLETAVPIYRFAVHPLHNPQKLSEAYQPLIDHLNSQLEGVQLELEASRDYQAYEQKFRERSPAFLLPNPWHTLQAQKVGYHVIAMAGDAEDFKGIFIVRQDSKIEKPGDLKGKVVSYPSPTALAAAIMPQYFLYTHGININRDIKNVYVGSQESSIMNVYLGKSAAGATWLPPWRLFQKDHPQEAAQLKLIWETPPLINNSVMARDDVSESVREQVRKSLLDLAQTPEGVAILLGMETTGFHAANDASYAVVSDYITHFEKKVRPVEIE
ncbi:phosphonate ABC transporter substrate-binding protein [Methylomonas lenta]|uniref:Phosphonate ABC transporter substrate-binding protein n=1 Tax=Methylomonas lenta TaxID=980561 RepID=A0A177MYB1_9GAMM|nr:phosphate/phosphite/phosphonate ABC transporter substrate-binding protein [Methylomonas lenta]OAI10677.1 phosphonate ABC transporter substrate-binding protein [Methylomonas lenta]